MGVIEKVDVPTEWCSRIVVVPKSNENVHMWWLHSVEQSCTLQKSPEAHNRANTGKAGWCKSESQSGCQQWVLATKVERERKAANHVYHSMGPLLLYVSTIWYFFLPRTLPTEDPGRIQEGLPGVECQMERHHCVRGKSSRAWQKARGGPTSHLMLRNVNSKRFLHQLLGKDEIRANPSKITAVKYLAERTDVHKLRRFLGMVNQSAFTVIQM